MFFRLKVRLMFWTLDQRQVLQRIGNCMQVPLRQMQVLGGGLQVAVTEQNLDGAQVGAGF